MDKDSFKKLCSEECPYYIFFSQFKEDIKSLENKLEILTNVIIEQSNKKIEENKKNLEIMLSSEKKFF